MMISLLGKFLRLVFPTYAIKIRIKIPHLLAKPEFPRRIKLTPLIRWARYDGSKSLINSSTI